MKSGQSKRDLRARLLAERRALGGQECAVRSEAVLSRLQTLQEFCRAPLVLMYVASKDHEVDTRPLLDLLAAQGRTVGAPRALGGGAMEWHRVRQVSELAVGRFGILEPKDGLPVLDSFPEGTAVLVPGIAFTRQGDRIGYGGGYFDRFLNAFTGVSIGLAYDFQVVEQLELEAHDAPVSIVVTESSVYRRADQGTFKPEI
ncbi:MAG: 5-formyltetrahydrofolate cyclo-ligase [Candidatus Hydrogenedentes bacterium]|nr:5-formyltetrahydrofolate cyclo-ligase [Candidatus Hydrogenedentota bacterium]